jgi:hypothetical protein
LDKGRFSRLVFVVAGVVLLVAAVLKGYRLAVDSFFTEDFLPNRTIATLAILFELGLGLVLLAGVFPQLTRLIAIGCFTIFLVVSITHVVEGRSSCGCFGALQVTPWATGVLDLGLLGFLVVLPPPGRFGRERFRVLATACLFTAMAVPVFFFWNLNASQIQIKVLPETVEFFPIFRGQKAETKVLLKNQSQTKIEIDTVETSCPCLWVNLPQNVIKGGETLYAIVVFDLAQEPEFVGNLAIAAKGLTKNNQPIFQFKAKIEVLK